MSHFPVVYAIFMEWCPKLHSSRKGEVETGEKREE